MFRFRAGSFAAGSGGDGGFQGAQAFAQELVFRVGVEEFLVDGAGLLPSLLRFGEPSELGLCRAQMVVRLGEVALVFRGPRLSDDDLLECARLSSNESNALFQRPRPV